jgi:6-phosphogluconolactonase
LSPDGKFLYVSNRGHNSIAIFSIDQQSGDLTPVGHHPSGGIRPRNFVIDPTGKYLLAANRESNNVVVFRIDPATGQLSATDSEISINQPVCLKFLSIKNQ